MSRPEVLISSMPLASHVGPARTMTSRISRRRDDVPPLAVAVTICWTVAYTTRREPDDAVTTEIESNRKVLRNSLIVWALTRRLAGTDAEKDLVVRRSKVAWYPLISPFPNVVRAATTLRASVRAWF
jgi:hypothetical protein